MERAVLCLPRLSLSVLLLLSLWYPGAQAARLSVWHRGARILGALPSCNDVWGGIPNFDCYDPPTTPLPPCDFKHQNPGIDCSTDSQMPRRPKATNAAVIAAAASTQDSLDSINVTATQSVQGQLPACKDVPGGIQFLDCYDRPATPLPPCDVHHQNPGIDCSTDSQKPGPKAVISSAASTQVSHQLPPRRDVFDGIQGWDCYDPRSAPLPPCDGRQIDCDPRSLKPPPAPQAKQGATDIADLL